MLLELQIPPCPVSDGMAETLITGFIYSAPGAPFAKFRNQDPWHSSGDLLHKIGLLLHSPSCGLLGNKSQPSGSPNWSAPAFD